MHNNISWPDGKDFAFTVVDDTDLCNLKNVPPVYDFLHDHGFLTTKTVWPIAGANEPKIGGSTCEDENYLNWIQSLKHKGFEIALHNATYHTLERDKIRFALEKYKEFFGEYPKIHANHYGCKDSMYWGPHRFTYPARLVYDVATLFRNEKISFGHRPDSKYFWGDICHDHIKYVRNFTYPDINTMRSCPQMPYHDPRKPYVKHWFASSDGGVVERFNSVLQEKNQERLKAERGVCIMYTHFAEGFFRNDKLDDDFKRLMKSLSKKNGWFVPAGTILDFLLQQDRGKDIRFSERLKLELRWFVGKFFLGGTT